RPAPGAGEAGVRGYTAGRTRELAAAFRELYETVRQSAESTATDGDVATVYDRAAEAVCAACPRKSECWTRDYVDTLSMLGDAARAMREKGRLETGDLPPRFREGCRNPEGFAAAVNMELRAMAYRRQLRARLEENRTAAYGQYQYLAGVLDAMAEELRGAEGPDPLAERRLLRYLNSRDVDGEVSVFRDRSGRLRAVIDSARLGLLYREEDYMDRISQTLGTRMCRPAGDNGRNDRLVLLEAEPLAVSVGVAAVKKEGEPVSGDRGTYFKTDQGVLCVLLSDGMGSGEAAARESISVVRMLERFLRSGVEPATAMKILNSVMLLRNGDHWGYATVDLMCVDLFTGQTGFYKYGAAPSFIRAGKSVRRVKGISMAAGILAGEGEAPDVVRMRLRPGGVAVIASDGVVTREDDTWLRQLLLDYDGGDTRELARSVIRRAGQLYGYSDDMTVLAVRVEERA
ncbi:MAG: SpoIIE family protein phosphatase, partial [Oscillospiraceae bacterium]|nr:SpoIIE family protein phosphatase [Oscillospiraceae bacterium]